MKHGKGSVNYYNGDKYNGYFFEDQIAGSGRYTFATGDYYEG